MLCSIIVPKIFTEVDRVRYKEGNKLEERYYLPNPKVSKALSLGYHTMVADLFWIRTILIFSDFVSHCRKENAEWLLTMMRMISHFDPKWRTLYFYGGTMMAVCEQVDAADEMYLLAHQNLPDDYFFPFSLAMNAYLYHKDYVAAEKWMREAAGKEGAPNWYNAAVAGMINQQGQRLTSIKYLEEELKTDLSPSVRSMTEERLRLLLHEHFSDEINEEKKKVEFRLGRPITTVDEIEIKQIDPWEEGWLLASDGIIRSIEMERREIKDKRSIEREMLKQ